MTKGNVALRELNYIPAHERVQDKIRVAVYARVSSNSEEQLNSFESQVSHYTRLIKTKENYVLSDIYADEGISGITIAKRLEFLRMMEDAKLGKIDKIITKSISRFARNARDGIAALRDLKVLGVNVEFEKENIKTENLTSENLLALYSILAERESQSISVNCKKAIRARMSRGEFKIMNPPFGYKLVGDTLEIIEEQAVIVKRIYNEYLKGSGALLIAKQLKADGIEKKDDTTDWTKNTVMNILKNEKYIGDILMQKKYREDVLPHKCKANHGQVEKYYVKGTHEAIISEEVYKVVQDTLKTRDKSESYKFESNDFSRKIKCAHCGSTLRKKVINNKVYWVCRKRDAMIDSCDSKAILEQDIKLAFIKMYNKLQRNGNSLFAPLLKDLDKLEGIVYKDSEELKEINTKIAEITEQNQMLTGLMTDGILDSAIFISKTDELNLEIKDLKKRKSNILKYRDSNKIIEETYYIQNIIKENDEHIVEFKNEMFEEIVEKIEITKDETITFHMINGLKFKEKVKDGTK